MRFHARLGEFFFDGADAGEDVAGGFECGSAGVFGTEDLFSEFGEFGGFGAVGVELDEALEVGLEWGALIWMAR